MGVEIDGLDRLQQKLRNLGERARELDGEHDVPLNEAMPPSFMSRYTDFASVEEMFEKSPWNVESAADFKAIPDAEWESFITQHTVFDSWLDMQKKAGASWAKKQLGL